MRMSACAAKAIDVAQAPNFRSASLCAKSLWPKMCQWLLADWTIGCTFVHCCKQISAQQVPRLSFSILFVNEVGPIFPWHLCSKHFCKQQHIGWLLFQGSNLSHKHKVMCSRVNHAQFFSTKGETVAACSEKFFCQVWTFTFRTFNTVPFMETKVF